MNWADLIILAILVVSSLISLKRGFIKEALSLVNWFLAFFVAMTFRDVLSSLLDVYIATPSLRDMVAFAGLFAATLIVGAMVNNLLVEIVRITGLGGTDRTFGMIFGLLRGFLIVMAVLILAPPLLGIDQDLWWQQSLLIPELLKFEGWAKLLVSELTNLVTGLF
ncbi:MAG: membrane protein required for colicin V production [Flavobacteriales bacterium]|jgi:membrane protein required for colicin V production